MVLTLLLCKLDSVHYFLAKPVFELHRSWKILVHCESLKNFLNVNEVVPDSMNEKIYHIFQTILAHKLFLMVDVVMNKAKHLILISYHQLIWLNQLEHERKLYREKGQSLSLVFVSNGIIKKSLEIITQTSHKTRVNEEFLHLNLDLQSAMLEVIDFKELVCSNNLIPIMAKAIEYWYASRDHFLLVLDHLEVYLEDRWWEVRVGRVVKETVRTHEWPSSFDQKYRQFLFLRDIDLEMPWPSYSWENFWDQGHSFEHVCLRLRYKVLDCDTNLKNRLLVLLL